MGEVFRIAVLEIAHGHDADCTQESDIALAHSLDPHVIGRIGEIEQPLFADPGPAGEQLAALRALGLLEQPLRGTDSDRLERADIILIEPVDVGDRVGHKILPHFPVGRLRAAAP